MRLGEGHVDTAPLNRHAHDVQGRAIADCGTTLIAAEKLGRKARCMEIDPAYCDTIIRRWHHWTGEVAIRIVDGVSFDSLVAYSAAGES